MRSLFPQINSEAFAVFRIGKPMFSVPVIKYLSHAIDALFDFSFKRGDSNVIG
jgi:hypothetical protein